MPMATIHKMGGGDVYHIHFLDSRPTPASAAVPAAVPTPATAAPKVGVLTKVYRVAVLIRAIGRRVLVAVVSLTTSCRTRRRPTSHRAGPSC